MTTEYVHVGRHADILASCRHIGPGDRIPETELDLSTDDHAGEDQHLVDEGRLVAVDSLADGPSNAAQIIRDRPAPASSSTLSTAAQTTSGTADTTKED